MEVAAPVVEEVVEEVVEFLGQKVVSAQQQDAVGEAAPGVVEGVGAVEGADWPSHHHRMSRRLPHMLPAQVLHTLPKAESDPNVFS